MVRTDPALRRLLRDTGKLLQPYGFDGTEAPWVRIEPDGVASVGRTRVSRTWADGQQVLKFGLHLDATPRTWWEFGNWRNEQHGMPPIPLEKASGPALIDDHRLPEELIRPWSLRVDPDQPGGHALQSDIDTIRAELPRRVHAYARRAIALADPDRYLDELLAQPGARIGTREAVVVLLADRGPGARLDEAIHRLRDCVAQRASSPFTEDVIEFARIRSAAAVV
ncbi:hypothetical protein [Nocardia jinanensis]|uniref:DUF4304 domain-containing protein n=1 Tax=Nocardia jinanensis TaxID=382504 RepID=A0A917VWF7_9NOCA|nr:hypothetical protein [Nocardia jinanensis]GGL31935.1 hypothetical protein GCM10011588_53370 [Nocardia jinanensis]